MQASVADEFIAGFVAEEGYSRMGATSVIFKFLVSQTKISSFYSHRTDALVELDSADKLTMKVIEGSLLKNGKNLPEAPVDTRITYARIPAGHWLVLSRPVSEKEIDVRLRRLPEPMGVLNAPTQLVLNDAFAVASNETLGLVRNGMTRSLAYRLIVRTDTIDNNDAFYVQSGGDAIYPISGAFILDTVVPGGGTLEIRGIGGNFGGYYDLFVDL